MISIIVPVYNAEKYLDKCLSSLSNQSFFDYEIIIVNDGSTDNSKSIIERYCKYNNHFVYLEKENGGQVSSYLLGINHSNGDYIGFVDSDDFIREDMFELMYNKAKETDCEIVICKRIDVDQNNNIIGEEKDIIKEGFYTGIALKEIYDLTFPKFNGVHMHNSRWNKIFKRDLIMQNLCYCFEWVRTFEDRFIVPSCVFSAKSIYIYNDNLYYYRHLPTGSHAKTRPELLTIIKKLYESQTDMLIKYNHYVEYSKHLDEALLNYVSLYIDRNIVKPKLYKEKYKYSRELFNDKLICKKMKENKKELTGKKGMALKLCYPFKLSFLFSLLCCLV